LPLALPIGIDRYQKASSEPAVEDSHARPSSSGSVSWRLRASGVEIGAHLVLPEAKRTALKQGAAVLLNVNERMARPVCK
jgi:hypothetical protein